MRDRSMNRAILIRIIFAIIIVLSLATTALAQNTKNKSFSKAKKLATKVYANHQTTFYCGCKPTPA